MKKMFKRIFILMICAFIIGAPIIGEIPKVEAASPKANSVVYTQAFISNKRNSGILYADYSGITAVSQSLYSVLGSTGDSIGTKEDFLDLRPGNAENPNIGLCTAGSEFTPYCNGYDLANYAKLEILVNGDVEITLQNGVTLANLRIYYILAKPNLLYCSNQICDSAKTVHSRTEATSSWRNKAKSGFLTYTGVVGEDFAKGYFDKQVLASGAIKYSGFNIFENIDGSDRVNSQNNGIYVTTSMTIKTNNKTYYVNTYAIDKTTFTSVGNENDDKKVSYSVTQDSTNTHPTQAVTEISQVAVLLMDNENRDIEDNQGYNKAKSYFNNTIRPIIAVVIGVSFIIVGVSTGATIAKSSDEPEVRSAAIKKLIGLFTGAVTVYLILFFYEPVIAAISNWF